MTSALAGLRRAEREDLDLKIYYADTEPANHPLWHSQLQRLADNRSYAQGTTDAEQFEELVRLEQTGNFGRKVALDFSYALSYAFNSSSSPYIAIFEDDVIFANGWLARSKTSLEKIVEQTEVGDKWLDMRLFNEERSIGWASKDVFGNNVPLVIIAGSVAAMSTLILLRKLSATGRSVITPGLIAVICCITIPSWIILFFQSGKSSVLPPSPGIKVQQWGCCTQGIILPREQIPDLALELIRRASTPPDIIIDEYASHNGLLRYVLNPVQLQHIGRSTFIETRIQLTVV